jgi:hypothetical protein
MTATSPPAKGRCEITWAAMNDCECPAGGPGGGKHQGMLLLAGEGDACTCVKCGCYCNDVPAEVYEDL